MTEIETNLRTFSKGAKPGGNPPVGYTSRPGQVVLGDIGMLIDSHGQWHYRGSPINRLELVKLFSSVLRRDEAGEYWLITPAEACRVKVDDAPFMAVEMTCEHSGKNQEIRFRTNVDHIVVLNQDHPLEIRAGKMNDDPVPYVKMDHGLEAKLARPIYYEVMELCVEETIAGDNFWGLWSGGRFFPVSRTQDLEA